MSLWMYLKKPNHANMICPLMPELNKATQFGDKFTAKNFYSVFGDFKPTYKESKEAELIKRVQTQVYNYGADYFRLNFPSLYYDVDKLSAHFASKIDPATIVEFKDAGVVTTAGYKPYITGPEITTRNLSKMGETLSKLYNRTGIRYEMYNDPQDKRKGYYSFDERGRYVKINTAYATADTPIHEYLHPIVAVIEKENPSFYEYLLNEAKTQDQEELVEFLGKQAAKRSNIFYQIIEFLKSIMRKLFNRSIDEYTTLGEFMSYLNYSSSKIDVDKSYTLFTANQAASVYQAAMGSNISERMKFNVDVIKDLIDNALKLKAPDDSLYYQDENNNDVAKRVTSFVGDREVGVFSLKKRGKEKSDASSRAEIIFKENGIPLDGKIQTADGLLSLEDLTLMLERTADEARIKGKIGHAYIEYKLSNSPEALENATMWANKLYPGVPLNRLEIIQNLERDLQLILNLSGINVSVDGTKRYDIPDRIAPEVVLVSSILKDENGKPLATTADGVIQTKYNQLKLVDWKFGNLTSDSQTSHIMAYGDVKDSKLSKAKLELVMRAIMLKERYEGASFEFLRLVGIRGDNYNTFDVDMQPYLDMIGNYYKENNKEVYNELQKRKLLNEETYMGVRPLTIKYIHELDKLPSFADKVQWVENRLNEITLNSELSVEPTSVKQQRAALTQLYQELTAAPGTKFTTSMEDIPKTFGQLKNFSDIAHPIVQTFHQEFLRRKTSKNNEFEGYATKATKLLGKVLEEAQDSSKKRKLVRNILSTMTAVGVVTLNPILAFAPLAANIILRRTQTKRKDAFNFVWRRVKDGTRNGYYMNTLDTYNDNGVEKPLTKAQREYRDYVVSTMRSLYTEVMGAPAFVTSNGKVLTKAEVMNRPLVLPDDFAPRYPKSIDEHREGQPFYEGGFGVLTSAKDYFKRNLTSLIEDEFHNNDSKGGLPLKFYSHFNSKIVKENLHTMDMQMAYHQFMDSLLEKKYGDGLYSIAEGVKNTLELKVDETGKQKYPELVKWMQNVITAQVLKSTDGLGMTSSKWVVKVPDKVKEAIGIPKNQELTLDQTKMLMMLKSWVTFAGMGFSAVGAAFNTALITVTNTMNVTKPLISRLMGIPPEDIQVSEKGVAKAYAEYTKHLGMVMAGKGDESKLFLMAKKFDWLPDNYDYKAGRDTLFADVTSPSLFSHAYMFHNLGETYGALVHLAMMTNSIKLGKKSIWDSYKVENGELVWVGGTRGKVEIADGVFEDLKELDDREMKNLRRAYEKLHGSYRSEERTAIETTVVGQFLFQFKKFFFTYLKNLYSSPLNDITVGRYVLDKNISRPDDVPVWKWEEEVMTGRVRVGVAAIAAMVKLPYLMYQNDFKWDESKKEFVSLFGKKDDRTKQQAARLKAMMELANTGMWLITMMLLLGAAFDDDDESYAKKRLTRLVQDASSGLLPVDIFDTIQKPVIAFDRIAKTGKAFLVWAADDENKDGSRKGSTTLMRSIPVLSNQLRMVDLFENTSVETSNLFGIFPTDAR